MYREDNWICSLTELIGPFTQQKMQSENLKSKIKYIYVLIWSVLNFGGDIYLSQLQFSNC